MQLLTGHRIRVATARFSKSTIVRSPRVSLALSLAQTQTPSANYSIKILILTYNLEYAFIAPHFVATGNARRTLRRGVVTASGYVLGRGPGMRLGR
jgi:hypothetical protein